jgi:hypothetical protein
MKKANRPGSAKKPAQKRPAAKKSAEPKARKAHGQGELAQVVARLASSAEKLAEAADRLAEVAQRNPQIGERQTGERQTDTFKTLSESIADLTASGKEAEVAETPDSTASEEHPEMPDDRKDR